MTCWIVLLRGINVGGKHKLPMAEVRAALTASGFGDVRTYIQSGNVILDAEGGSDPANRRHVRDQVQETLESLTGFEIPTVVLSVDELVAILEANPFTPAEPKLEHVFFHDGPVPDAERNAVERLMADVQCETEVRVDGRVIYLHTPEGLSNSPLVAKWSRVKSSGTGRNLATLAKLADLTNPSH